MLYAGYLSKDKEFHFGKDKVKDIVDINIIVSKNDWDSFETSWDFKKHPLV